MRKLIVMLSVIAVMILGGNGVGGELKNVDRKIGKEPVYQTKKPKYCLLVFGESLAKVWLVLDGNVLYVDRNQNGDLTEPNERFVSKEQVEKSNSLESTYRFEIGDLQVGSRLHQNLTVQTWPLTRMAGYLNANEILAKDPEALEVRITANVATAKHRGAGVGGRLQQGQWHPEPRGYLQFATTPAAAPILHFGGPRELVPSPSNDLQAGREFRFALQIGTPGIGIGSTVLTQYAGFLPGFAYPKVSVKFPGAPPIEREFELKDRCCTFDLFGPVSVPQEAIAGKAIVSAYMVGEETLIGAGLFSADVAKPGFVAPALMPVSKRLTRELIHPSPTAQLTRITFSPDGERLVAHDYQAGLLQVWKVKSGELLTTVEAGRKSTLTAIHPSWESVFLITPIQMTVAEVHQGGKKLRRYSANNFIGEWSVRTGQLLRRFQTGPKDGMLDAAISPDGNRLITLSKKGGDWQHEAPQTLTSWDLKTNCQTSIGGGGGDRRLSVNRDCTMAVTTQEDNLGMVTGLEIVDLTKMNSTRKVAVPIENALTEASMISHDNSTIIRNFAAYAKRGDWLHFSGVQLIWDSATGKLIATFRDPAGLQTLYRKIAPNGEYAVGDTRTSEGVRISFLNLKSKQIDRTVLLDLKTKPEEKIFCWAFEFSPDSRWLAVASHLRPDNRVAAPKDAAQPLIHLIDVQKGVVKETFVSQQATCVSMAFSPDGRTLASGGEGKVLLWNVGDITGVKPTQTEPKR